MAKIRILTVEFVFKTGSIAADAAALYTYATLGSWHDGVPTRRQAGILRIPLRESVTYALLQISVRYMKARLAIEAI